MTNVYNSTDKLYWVFTNYGKSRLAELNSDDHLFLYKAGIGSYNWYKDEQKYLGSSGYTEGIFKRYFENENERTLGQLIQKVAINNKNLETAVDDEGNTIAKVVVLSFTIPETLGNIDIREIGIYETIDDVDHLFAICTMQPIPKPSTETNHYIAVKTNARLQSEMLSNAYEQIILDPNNNFATVEELNSFEENLLFVGTNLAEQVSNNARIIGYDRPQQLYEKIVEDRIKYSNFALSTTYANMLNMTSLLNIKSFWTFQTNNDITKALSISDLSYYGINMTTDTLVTQYESGYEGLAPWLNFEYNPNTNVGNHYMLGGDIEFDLAERALVQLSDTETEIKNIQEVIDNETPYELVNSAWTVFFAGAQNTNEHECTLMAKDNSEMSTDVKPAFNISITKQCQLKIRLFSDRHNYIDYITGVNSIPEAGKFYVLSITYKPVVNEITGALLPRFYVTVNGKNISGNIYKTAGTYKGMPITSLPVTSRIHDLDTYKNYVDSKVCVMSVVRDDINDNYIQAVIYNLMALIGVNPCLIQ